MALMHKSQVVEGIRAYHEAVNLFSRPYSSHPDPYIAWHETEINRNSDFGLNRQFLFRLENEWDRHAPAWRLAVIQDVGELMVLTDGGLASPYVVDAVDVTASAINRAIAGIDLAIRKGPYPNPWPDEDTLIGQYFKAVELSGSDPDSAAAIFYHIRQEEGTTSPLGQSAWRRYQQILPNTRGVRRSRLEIRNEILKPYLKTIPGTTTGNNLVFQDFKKPSLFFEKKSAIPWVILAAAGVGAFFAAR